MNNLLLFVCTFSICFLLLESWYIVIKKKNDANDDLKKIQRSKKPYKVFRPEDQQKR